MTPVKKLLRISVKIVLWVAASLLLLLLCLVLLIQVPSVQNFARKKAVSYLTEKLQTPVRIDSLSIEFPKQIVLKGIYLADRRNDTLLAARQIRVDIAMFQLLKKHVQFNKIVLDGITSHISRAADSSFNFDYIADAFASPGSTADTTRQTPGWKISLGDIQLDSISFAYRDSLAKDHIQLYLQHFTTHFNRFDLDKMRFAIPNIVLSGVDAQISQQQTSGPATDQVPNTASVQPDLQLGSISLSAIHLRYGSTAMEANISLGTLLAKFNKTDLSRQLIDLQDVALRQTNAAVILKKPRQVDTALNRIGEKADSLTGKETGIPWALELGRLTLADNNMRFDDESHQKLDNGIDFFHLDIHHLNARLDNFSSKGDTLSGQLRQLAFSEKSGLQLDSLHTRFLYSSTKVALADLYAATPKTVLRKSLTISYPSIAAVTQNLGSIGIDADLPDCRVAMSDVVLFAPFLSKYPAFRNIRTEVLKISGKINGTVSDLAVPLLAVNGPGNISLAASGSVKGLPEINSAYMALKVQLRTTSADITRLMPPQALPKQVRIPDRISLQSVFNGSMKYFRVQLAIQCSDGSAQLNGSLDSRRKGAERYKASLQTNSLNIGRIIRQSPQQLGRLSMSANINGVSLDPHKATLRLEGRIAQLGFRQYEYHDLLFSATSADGQYTANASMNDPNISFHLNGSASLGGSYPSAVMQLTADSIDAAALHFSKTPLRFHGKLDADFPVAVLDSLNGRLTASELMIATGGRRIAVDTICLRSVADRTNDSLFFAGPSLTAQAYGNYRLSQTAAVFQHFIRQYFNTAPADSAGSKIAGGKQTTDSLPSQQFHFQATAFRSPILDSLLPDLKKMDTIRLAGAFDSRTPLLETVLHAPSVVYGNDTINNLRLNIHTTGTAINYIVDAGTLKAGTLLSLNAPSLYGAVQDNQLRTTLLLRDQRMEPFYRIGGILTAIKNGYEFHLFPDSLLLAGTAWQVPGGNLMRYSSEGLWFRDFSLSDGRQQLSVNSTTTVPGSPVKISFNDFTIETLARIARQDTLLAGGILNGEALIDSLSGNPSFTAGLRIDNLNFRQDTIGNIELKANNHTAGSYAVQLGLTGGGNQVQLSGNYTAAGEGGFDLALAIRQLHIKSLEGFTGGSIKDCRGYLSGDLKINGTIAAPAIYGDIRTNDIGFSVPMLNSFFRLPKESVSFNDQQIIFNKVNILDSLNDRLTVDGFVQSKHYRDYTFNLHLNARDFRAINSTHADNPLYYGKLYMDAHLQISGDMKEPTLSGTLGVNSKTDLTVVLPTEDPSIEDRQGVVEFIDKDSLLHQRVLVQQATDSIATTGFRGFNASATININKDAAFTILVDERNGDVVHLKGSASLNGGIDPSGNMSLTGNYEVNEGSYDLSYATVKRRFIFQKGSRIVWTGDPMSANIDLTAVYKALVPPIDLVENQLSSNDNNVFYKEKLPFNVLLHMRNQLMKPDLSFDIVLPDSTYNAAPQVLTNVDTRLSQIRQDPNEMNKQVLGVLVLGHFIGDNPLESGAGGTSVEGLVRNSVSSLLSDQLNRLAGDLIHGVDVDFGLTSGEDYSSGTATNRTDLNVGLSKNFLNDRLTVTVGNNFNLEGAQPGEKATNIAGNVSVNYKLSKDGRYMLNAYRRDRFIVIQGEVVETGVGFTLTVDYNRFREILLKRSKWRTPKRSQE